MSELATETGKCQCGIEVARELPETARARSFLASIPFLCDDCSQQGDEEDNAARLRSEEEGRRRAFEVRKRASGVPPHLADFGFEDIDARGELESAITLAKRWAVGEVKGALISGDVGVGKTRVAVAAVNELLRRAPVRFMPAPLLLARLGTGAFDSPQRVEALTALTGDMALALDDIDKARPSEYAAEHVFLAVDARADGAAPLLVTTNMRIAEMEARWPEPYGEAIASRLALLEGVRVSGSDRRLGG